MPLSILCDIFHQQTKNRPSKSQYLNQLIVPVSHLNPIGDHSFRNAAPCLWNSLLVDLISLDSLDQFLNIFLNLIFFTLFFHNIITKQGSSRGNKNLSSAFGKSSKYSHWYSLKYIVLQHTQSFQEIHKFFWSNQNHKFLSILVATETTHQIVWMISIVHSIKLFDFFLFSLFSYLFKSISEMM